MPRGRGSKSKAKKKIQIGNKMLSYGKQVLPMTDSSDLWLKQDLQSLRLRLETDGYLLIRSIIPKHAILAARTQILQQAFNEGSIMVDDERGIQVEDGRITRLKNKFADSYCLDAWTGSETGGADNRMFDMDINRWQAISSSKTCERVYKAPELMHFWRQLFSSDGKSESTVESDAGNHNEAQSPSPLKALVKETFLRLMGNSSTQEHADYYYFKRDTQVFDAKQGRKAQRAMKECLLSHNLWDSELYTYTYTYTDANRNANTNTNANDANANANVIVLSEREKQLFCCAICEEFFDPNTLGAAYMDRVTVGDFGTQGNWHCRHCARLPLAIYTTWICLSELRAPKDSILAMCPRSHLLRNWDSPHLHRQTPSDFHWKMPWVIPEQISFGDIIIFNIKTIHASSKNAASPRKYRCSFDTRIHLSPYIANDGNANANANANANGQWIQPEEEDMKQCNHNTSDDNSNDENDPSLVNSVSKSLSSLNLEQDQ